MGAEKKEAELHFILQMTEDNAKYLSDLDNKDKPEAN